MSLSIYQYINTLWAIDVFTNHVFFSDSPIFSRCLCRLHIQVPTNTWGKVWTAAFFTKYFLGWEHETFSRVCCSGSNLDRSEYIIMCTQSGLSVSVFNNTLCFQVSSLMLLHILKAALHHLRKLLMVLTKTSMWSLWFFFMLYKENWGNIWHNTTVYLINMNK